MTIWRKIGLGIVGVIAAVIAIAAIRVIGLVLAIALGVIVAAFLIPAIRRSLSRRQRSRAQPRRDQ